MRVAFRQALASLPATFRQPQAFGQDFLLAANVQAVLADCREDIMGDPVLELGGFRDGGAYG